MASLQWELSRSLQWEARQKNLCTVPVAVLVTIAALDSADKALLGASFPMLEKTLGLHGMSRPYI